MQMVIVTLKVYLPNDVVDEGADAIEEYLNNKLHEDPEFFGEVDAGCFELTGEREAD